MWKTKVDARRTEEQKIKDEAEQEIEDEAEELLK